MRKIVAITIALLFLSPTCSAAAQDDFFGIEFAGSFKENGIKKCDGKSKDICITEITYFTSSKESGVVQLKNVSLVGVENFPPAIAADVLIADRKVDKIFIHKINKSYLGAIKSALIKQYGEPRETVSHRPGSEISLWYGKNFQFEVNMDNGKDISIIFINE